MAKHKQRQKSLPVMSPEVAKAFDEYVQCSEKIKAANKFDGRKRKAKKVVTEAMDAAGADRVSLPDGRIVQREEKKRQRPAKPAHEQSWHEIFEATE